MKNIVILGSTGSIGCAVLDVIRDHPDEFMVTGLATNTSIDQLERQAREFGVRQAAVYNEQRCRELDRRSGDTLTCTAGMAGLVKLAGDGDADIVVNSVVGSIGVGPTLTALNAGKRVALANKETLVMAGSLIMDRVRTGPGELIPIDSEHSALHQCLRSGRAEEVKRLILTASGGPFRQRGKDTFRTITLQDALAHPTWSMGNKITIDSATLMNKGLEVIEAHWLFGLPAERISVVIHPESIVHSMVEYTDSSVICQLSTPDMRLPVQYALTFPERLRSDFARIDLVEAGTLTFHQPDQEKFPCLRLAYDALNEGGSMPAVLNAANEVAVNAFLKEQIGYPDIPALVSAAMDAHTVCSFTGIEEVREIDAWARETTRTAIRDRFA